jgi:hypothetical protein
MAIATLLPFLPRLPCQHCGLDHPYLTSCVVAIDSQLRRHYERIATLTKRVQLIKTLIKT